MTDESSPSRWDPLLKFGAVAFVFWFFVGSGMDRCSAGSAERSYKTAKAAGSMPDRCVLAQTAASHWIKAGEPDDAARWRETARCDCIMVEHGANPSARAFFKCPED